MRVLFVPCTDAVRPHLILPHLIPLVALASRLKRGEHQMMFLAPKYFHGALRALDCDVLDMDYDSSQAFRREMMAYGRFSPDVVVDDMSGTVLLSTKLSGLPRVTIRRTGIFPGVAPRNERHKHSLMHPGLIDRYRGCEEVCGMPPPKSFVDVYASDVSVVPGIPAIERPPDAVSANPDYVFSGPLILPDHEVGELTASKYQDVREALSEFEALNRHRKIVIFTVGTMLSGWNVLSDVIRHMIDSGAAVISTIELPELSSSPQFFFSSFLPLHAACGLAQFMIHHCGSGTYQYQLIHALPAICIGSGCYDRDDVAARLDDLGIAKYIPSPEECPEFLQKFRANYDKYSDNACEWNIEAKTKLKNLRALSEQTSTEFDFDSVLKSARARGMVQKGAR